jgi:hypothetical protein
VSQNRWNISGGVAKKLLNQLREELHLKRYSYRTEQAYMDWLRTFILSMGNAIPLRWARSKSSPSSSTWLKTDSKSGKSVGYFSLWLNSDWAQEAG